MRWQDVDEVEESVFSPARTDDSTRIYVLKREISEVRRAVLPLREPMRKFSMHSDIAPTILRILGVMPPRTSEGTVIESALLRRR